MPFELGLAIAWSKLNPTRHTWFVAESVERRAQKSLSDLNGTDPNVHHGSPEGVMRELCNAFVRREHRPRVPQMMRSYGALTRIVPKIKQNTGSSTVFTATMFEELIAAAAIIRDKTRTL